MRTFKKFILNKIVPIIVILIWGAGWLALAFGPLWEAGVRGLVLFPIFIIYTASFTYLIVAVLKVRKNINNLDENLN